MGKVKDYRDGLKEWLSRPKEQQPDLHAPGWPELRFHGRAKTDGRGLWWHEEQMDDGSVKRRPLQPYEYIAGAPPDSE